MLLIERADKPGYWQSVTGSKDRIDEPLRETCVREVAEETGIVDRSAAVPTVSAARLAADKRVRDLPGLAHRYAPGVTHNTEHVFGLTVPAGTAVTLNPREHLRHQWLPYREAADRCFSPSNAEAILQLAALRAHGAAP